MKNRLKKGKIIIITLLFILLAMTGFITEASERNTNEKWTVIQTIAWPQGGTTRVAFEDLPSSIDYDYNDWVADIDTIATYYHTPKGRFLTSMVFTITPQARGACYHHRFHLRFPPDTFDSCGRYRLQLFDEFGNILSTDMGIFNAKLDNDFIVIPNTYIALPGIRTNAIEPPGFISHFPNMANTNPAAPMHQPYVTAKRTAVLSLCFCKGTDFDLYNYDPSEGFHGEGYFFDAYLHVLNTGENIHTGTAKMLSVPADWLWPEEIVPIWYAYPALNPGNPPVFTYGCWSSCNDLVYNGCP